MKKLSLYLFLLFSIVMSSQEVSENDKNSLIALYTATNGSNWFNTWDLNTSPTEWFGVTTIIAFVNGDQLRLVTEINLSDNNLAGTIPDELGNLKDLKTLDLSNNDLSGSIPENLGNAEDLNNLYLQNNNLNGDIPIPLFSLNERHFVNIDLSFNKLTGTLPTEMGDAIANIGHVNVSNNLLTNLPDYTNVTLFRIETLDISNNNIYFSVFERVSSFDPLAEVLEGNVANLTYTPQNKVNEIKNIALIGNENITLSVTDLTSANNTYQWSKNEVVIDGATNSTYQITNATVSDIGTYFCEVNNPQVPNLTIQRSTINIDTPDIIKDREALIALYNETNGPNWVNTWNLNTDISTWHGVSINIDKRVTKLDLEFNDLSGELPEEIWDLTELEELDFFFNDYLTGEILPEISNLSKLKSLNFGYTQVGGNLPNEFFSITSLESVYFGSKFTGSLTGINNLINLKNFTSSEARFSTIPDSFWTLPKLVKVFLTSSDPFLVSFQLPSYIDQLTNLKSLTLYGNNTQNLPDQITNLTNLESLSLGGVNSGTIPQNIGNLVNLVSLSLNNGFEGIIPNSIGNLVNLTSISLENNELTGVIPKEIGNLVTLESLILRNNNLDGVIPSEITTLSNLKLLFLRSNNLSGPLPTDIGNLTSLTTLTLNENNFTGIIPQSIQNLSELNTLYLGDNSFVFEDLESNFSYLLNNINTFGYNPQKNIDEEETIIINQGEVITLSVEATQSTNNSYQWTKNGSYIDGATERTLTITNASSSDIGEYACEIINSIVTGILLTKNKITLDVTLDVESFNTAGIKAYPIPTKDKLILSLGSINRENITASLYGVLGDKIFEQKNVTDNQILDLSTLSIGTYILRLETDIQTYTSRIIKQ